MPKYALVEEAARHCWSKNFMEIFRDFYARNADLFLDAPLTLSGEQNLQYYSLFQEYLKMYEDTMQSYIESLDVSVVEFYRQLAEVKNDPEIKDKKLLHFVDYLIACTDYESFYKVMIRAAKKERAALDNRAESKSEGKSGDDRDFEPGEKQYKSDSKGSKWLDGSNCFPTILLVQGLLIELPTSNKGDFAELKVGEGDLTSMKVANVVYISGFLTPTDFVCYPDDLECENVNIITVYPSPVGSLHDRVCQIFYELVGGTVDFGAEHSAFHGHERFGTTFPHGKLPSWSADEPIILVGHSFGGATAIALHKYLAQGRFAGYDTNAAWILGVVGVNTPFNGALQVYNKGMDPLQPILVDWLSSGHIITCISHIIEYLNYSNIKLYFNPELGHWRLNRFQPRSLIKLFLVFCGFGVLSHTDHLAYDTSVQSQLHWQQGQMCFPCTYYVSIVGNINGKSVANMSWSGKFTYIYNKYCRSKAVKAVAGLDVSRWSDEGNDGLLSCHTQEFPRLSTEPNHKDLDSFNNEDVSLERGLWYCHYTPHSHLAAAFKDKAVWTTIMAAVKKIIASTDDVGYRVKTRAQRRRKQWSENELKEPIPTDRPDMQAHRLYLAACHPPQQSTPGVIFMIIRTIVLSAMVLLKMNAIFSAPEDDPKIVDRNLKSLVFVIPVVLAYFFLSLDIKQIPFAVVQGAEVLFAASRAILLSTTQDFDFILALFFVEALIFSVGFSLWSKYTKPLCKLMVAAIFDSLLSTQNAQQSMLVRQLSYFNLLPLLPSSAWLIVYAKENSRMFKSLKVSRDWLEVFFVLSSFAEWGIMIALIWSFFSVWNGASKVNFDIGNFLKILCTLVGAATVMMTKGNDLSRCVAYCLIKSEL